MVSGAFVVSGSFVVSGAFVVTDEAVVSGAFVVSPGFSISGDFVVTASVVTVEVVSGSPVVVSFRGTSAELSVTSGSVVPGSVSGAVSSSGITTLVLSGALMSSGSFAALYALQADLSPLSSASHSILKRARALAWVQRAGLTRRYTCYSMFTEKPSGLAADTVHFSENKDFETGAIGMEYKLRGEFAEMLYHLYMVTEDPIYV